ncbi:MAG: diguanylate cyclase [Gammaproteobacteria bacterium]|nr:diguanylate cyclase [Gammaproteobacteria bacterium]
MLYFQLTWLIPSDADVTAVKPEQPKKTDTLPLLLLVEDSQTTTALLSKYLGHGYHLLHAKDGAEAWEILESNPEIALVITDIHMPNMTGHQLLVKIRKSENGRYKNLPVIVMTTAEDNVDRNLAFLNGANDFVTKPIDEMEMVARVNVHYRLARTIRELESSQHALAEQATTDSLTRLKNRRAFFENGAKALAMARRYMSDLSVILLDIDHFKKINDTFGHSVGDDALVVVAGILMGLSRTEDTVARIGGEEFAMLLPDTNRLGSAVLAERIRSAIEREQFISNAKIIPMTVSIGIASFGVDPLESIDQLLGVADNRLYLAKNSGRNRICVNDEGKATFA